MGYEILKKLIDNVRNGITIFIEEDRIVMEYDESAYITFGNGEYGWFYLTFKEYFENGKIRIEDYTLNRGNKNEQINIK